MKRIFFLITAFSILSGSLFAQGIKVAAATNLQPVLKVLQADFKKKTGIEIEPILSSSGNLVSQIKNGAPYDVFLSADMTLPETLYKDGFSARKPVAYAQGSLIICSNQDIGFENWERILLTRRIQKIAIADPAIAPYGKATEEVLQQKDILVNIKSKIVIGESVSQVNTYITTGAVDLGFTTQALVKDPANKTKLYWEVIDPSTYSPIEQGMVLLKHAETNADAERFYQYLLSPAAQSIFVEYGYRLK